MREFISRRLLPHFLCWEGAFLVCSNAVWNCMMVKCCMDNFIRSITYRKDNPITVVSIDFSKDKVLFLP